MSISLHPDTPQGRTLAGTARGGRGACGANRPGRNPQPAVHQIRRAVRRGGRRCAAVQRDFRGFLLLSRTQGGPDPHSARAGRGRRGQDRPVHQGNRKPARLDHPIAVVGGSIEQRRFDALAAVAAGAGDHRTGAGRFHRQGAAAGVAARHGRAGQRHRPFQGSEIHRSRRPQGLLRAGVFPPRIRALHDAVAGRHPQGRRRQHRRGQSEADLGRGLADQGRRARPRLCGRRRRAA